MKFNADMTAEFIYAREEELQGLRLRLAKRKPFLIHGPEGVGKTLLLSSLLPESPAVLYCEDSATTQIVFRSLAHALVTLRNHRVQATFRNQDAIKAKSAVSLKGIVMDALREGCYCIVLDHLKQPSHSFAAAVREIMNWGSTPVIAVARSSHMEDTGFLQTLYSDRSEKYEIRNFTAAVAEQFVEQMVNRAGLSAQNMTEFLDKLLEFSEGNPGAIVSMLQMAKYPKYRSDEHIKITPLYIDFRMHWSPAARSR
jgi:hypothetical protein